MPQLYQLPSAKDLLAALRLVVTGPSSFAMSDTTSQVIVNPAGVPNYLTGIIASPLKWINDDNDKELIWDLASRGLSEKSGRTAMGDISRTFVVPSSTGTIDVDLNEPALTEDNLGFKTWASSYILARRLHMLKPPSLEESDLVLELGAGTGLVGIAAALIWNTPVVMTDLPEIEPNLAQNIRLNSHHSEECRVEMTSGVLNWAAPKDLHIRRGSNAELELVQSSKKARVVLGADSLYSPEHPRLFVNAVRFWLDRTQGSRLIIANPLRKAYAEQRKELHELLQELGLEVIQEGVDVGRDDWAEEVSVMWAVWGWRVSVVAGDDALT